MQLKCDYCTRELYAGHDPGCVHYVSPHQLETIMAKHITSASPTHRHEMKTAGCPQAHLDGVVNHLQLAGFDWSRISELLALAAKYGPTFWTMLQEFLALQNPPTLPTQP